MSKFSIVPLASITVHAPGRINLIGEHTDYNGGFVMPAAIDKGITIHVEKNGSPTNARLEARDLQETFNFDLDNFNPVKMGWPNYLLGVVREFQKAGATIPGFNAIFEGNIPIGAGMSSSAALECSLACALNNLFNLGFSDLQLIHFAQMAEHHFVGTKCGIMDMLASMMGKKDHVIYLDCRSMEFQYYPLELIDCELLLLNTNVSHSLAESAYNERRTSCEEGVLLLQKSWPEIAQLRDVSLEQLEWAKPSLPELIYRRCRHVVTENLRTQTACSALSKGDFRQLGQLMYASHNSLQHDYEVSCPELNFLVESAKKEPSILGSRMMGGGFGGCTLNLIEKNHAAEFIEIISKSYHKRFERNLTPYQVRIAEGAKCINST